MNQGHQDNGRAYSPLYVNVSFYLIHAIPLIVRLPQVRMALINSYTINY